MDASPLFVFAGRYNPPYVMEVILDNTFKWPICSDQIETR
jgi:hypothetical protein